MAGRRRLLRAGFWSSVALSIAGATKGIVSFAWSASARANKPVVLSSALLPKPGDPPLYVEKARAYVVNLRPGDGVHRGYAPAFGPAGLEHGGLVVLYQACTHLGCKVPWRPEFEFEGETGWFRCPCHEVTYTKGGVKVFGPALRDMDRRPMSHDDEGGLVIDITAVTKGRCNGSGCNR